MDTIEVNQAVGHLQVPITGAIGGVEGGVSDGFEACRSEMHAGFDRVMLRLNMVFWMTGMVFGLQVANLALVICLVLSKDRAGTPPPPPPRPLLQAPAGAETELPIDEVPCSQAPALAELDGSCVAEDPPTPSQGLGSADDSSARAP